MLPRDPGDDKGYALVGRFADGASVWRVVAPPAPAFVTLAGFAPPHAEQDGRVVYPFVASGGVGAIDLAAKKAGVVNLVFDARPPEGSRRVLRLGDSSEHDQPFTLQGWTRVSVLVRVPRGQSQLLVKTDPPATSEADAIVVSVPRAERATGTPTLQPPQISANPGF